MEVGFHLHSYLERFGEAGHTALRTLIDTDEPPDALEREALFALARYISDEQLIDGDWERPCETPAPAEQARRDSRARARQRELRSAKLIAQS